MIKEYDEEDDDNGDEYKLKNEKWRFKELEEKEEKEKDRRKRNLSCYFPLPPSPAALKFCCNAHGNRVITDYSLRFAALIDDPRISRS